MKTRSALFSLGAGLVASILLTGTASAQQTVYDNSFNYLNLTYAPGNNVEFGDQITLSPGARIASSFSFEYFLTVTNSVGAETAELSLRDMNGSVNSQGFQTPGGLLYDSGATPITAGFHTFSVTGLNFTVPNTLTWSVTFSGLGVGEKAGLLYYDPPTTGSSTDDFWQRDSSGNWVLMNTPIKDNFGARLIAVPEPTTLALLAGGLMGLAFMGFRRKH